MTPHPSFPPGPDPTGSLWQRPAKAPALPPAPATTEPAPGRPAGHHHAGGRGRGPLVVVASLIALVLLLGGSGFGFWQYNQGKYYVGVQDGYVAIFRGTSQSLAGISLSSLIQQSTLPVSQLRNSDRTALAQTIPQSGVSGGQALIDQLQGQVNKCRQQWQAVAAWSASNAKYQAELAPAGESKGTVTAPAGDNPGPQPTAPDAASCASAQALSVAVPASPAASASASASAAPALPASAVTADVYNGGSTSGLATSVSQALVAKGYQAGAVTDASAQSQAVTAGTQVFYGAGAAAQAEKIAKYFGARAAALLSLPAGHVEVLLGTGSTVAPAGLAPAHSTTAAATTPTCQYQGDPTCGTSGDPTPAPTSTCSDAFGNMSCGGGFGN